MGGFFLVCAGPQEDRQADVIRLQETFAELGFAPPEIVEAQGYIFGAYPKFQNQAAGLKRYPNGDFAFVCGTCLSEKNGLASADSLYEAAAAASPISEAIMGHYAAVVKKDGRTEIKLDRFGGYHLFYSLEARIVSSSFCAICSVLPSLTLSQQSACEYVFNGVVSGNETLFGEIKLAPSAEAGSTEAARECEREQTDSLVLIARSFLGSGSGIVQLASPGGGGLVSNSGRSLRRSHAGRSRVNWAKAGLNIEGPSRLPT